MSHEQNNPFVLAPGGLILNIPQNHQLIDLIEHAQKLSSKQLLDLAAFYQVYQTNAFLAEHLTLVALANAICEFGGNDPYWDWVEDQVCGYDQTTEEMNEQQQELEKRKLKEKLEKQKQRLRDLGVYMAAKYKGPFYSPTAVVHVRYEIKCISFPQLPGLGILIETSNRKDPHIIGVCPVLNG